MSQLTLQSSTLIERLAQAAEANQRSTEELLDIAVTEFLEKWAAQKIADEDRAFVRQHSQLVTTYLGEIVAIHNGQVIVHYRQKMNEFLKEEIDRDAVYVQ